LVAADAHCLASVSVFKTPGAQQQGTVSAAKQCAASLKANATAFKAQFRTFGACVSKKS